MVQNIVRLGTPGHMKLVADRIRVLESITSYGSTLVEIKLQQKKKERKDANITALSKFGIQPTTSAQTFFLNQSRYEQC